MKLSEQQHELTNQYLELLNTIEEAFDYVQASFQDYSKTEGDRVLADIFAAFVQVAESNETLLQVFQSKGEITSTIHHFADVIQQASKLDGKFDDPNQKEKVIRESIYPAFITWKEMVQKELQLHVLN